MVTESAQFVYIEGLSQLSPPLANLCSIDVCTLSYSH